MHLIDTEHIYGTSLCQTSPTSQQSTLWCHKRYFELCNCICICICIWSRDLHSSGICGRFCQTSPTSQQRAPCGVTKQKLNRVTGSEISVQEFHWHCWLPFSYHIFVFVFVYLYLYLCICTCICVFVLVFAPAISTQAGSVEVFVRGKIVSPILLFFTCSIGEYIRSWDMIHKISVKIYS